MKRKSKLYYLNQMEVLESDGGDMAYILVENNEENRKLLELAEIPLETALQFSSSDDNDDFCILSLAFNEGIANYISQGKLHNIKEIDELEELKEEVKTYIEALEHIERNSEDKVAVFIARQTLKKVLL